MLSDVVRLRGGVPGFEEGLVGVLRPGRLSIEVEREGRVLINDGFRRKGEGH